MATLDLISNKTYMHTTYALPTISEKNCLLFLKVLEDRVIWKTRPSEKMKYRQYLESKVTK